MDAQAFWNVIGHYNSQTWAVQAVLLLFYLGYPGISMLTGRSFPQMVTHIMPCPVVSLSIAVYAGYKRKNKALLALLTVWGLTGIKSIIFHAYEDIILLICSFYGSALLVNEIKRAKDKKTDSDSECT